MDLHGLNGGVVFTIRCPLFWSTDILSNKFPRLHRFLALWLPLRKWKQNHEEKKHSLRLEPLYLLLDKYYRQIIVALSYNPQTSGLTPSILRQINLVKDLVLVSLNKDQGETRRGDWERDRTQVNHKFLSHADRCDSMQSQINWQERTSWMQLKLYSRPFQSLPLSHITAQNIYYHFL